MVIPNADAKVTTPSQSFKKTVMNIDISTKNKHDLVNIGRIGADVKNGWCYTCIPPTRLRGFHMANFTFAVGQRPRIL
jgi:hypothetical protein